MIFKIHNQSRYSKLVIFIGAGVIIAVLIGAYFWVDAYLDRKIHGVAPGVTLEGITMEGYLPHEVSKIVELLAMEHEREYQNAGIHKQTGEVVPSKIGLAVDQEKTIGLVLYSSANTSLNLITYTLLPEITTEELQALTKTIGSYTTYFSGSPGRYQNVKTAVAAINNTILFPDRLFSFNLTTGPRTVNKGYREAPIIIGGAYGVGVGGGVCQVSSTLYNAVLNSKLNVVERHPHSKPVRYVPPNRDAAVSFGSKDLKFRNNLDYPVLIKASLHGSQINIWILGKEE